MGEDPEGQSGSNEAAASGPREMGRKNKETCKWQKRTQESRKECRHTERERERERRCRYG